MAASSDSNGTPSGTETWIGWGAASGEASWRGLRVTTTTKRSGLPRTVRAISKSSIVRAEERIIFTRALKLVSSGKNAALKYGLS
jgi:hypothetical protein